MTQDRHGQDGVGVTLARTDRVREPRYGLRAAGIAATAVAAPIIGRRAGGTLGRCKAEWPAIAGPGWAEASWPVALGRDGALKLHIAGPAALELQHRAPLLIERVNLFFGRAVVTRLILVQGPLPLPPSRRRALAAEPMTATQSAALDNQLATIGDADLRQALSRLGKWVGGGRSDV